MAIMLLCLEIRAITLPKCCILTPRL